VKLQKDDSRSEPSGGKDDVGLQAIDEMIYSSIEGMERPGNSQWSRTRNV
jgi:hypothetical protein